MGMIIQGFSEKSLEIIKRILKAEQEQSEVENSTNKRKETLESRKH
jgi:hypothetical protein